MEANSLTPGGSQAGGKVKSGYNGERIVTINPSDFALLAPMGRVTHDLFRRLNLNSDLVETDWGAVLQRRTSREPVERGGWSTFCTFWPGITLVTPVVNALVRGLGAAGWPGFFENATLEGMVTEWLAAPTPDDQKRIALAINREAMEQVSAIPLGVFRIRSAFRGLTGVRPGPSPYPWNVRRA